jgi:hypothetical protein
MRSLICKYALVYGTLLIGVSVAAISAPNAADVPVEAVEYYHQHFEHYFVTAHPGEIAALDSGAIVGWWRTGQRYRVYANPDDARSAVCRFYTGVFAGKASHFFTASADECEYVKRELPEWTYEGIAFYVQIPDPGGTCPSGTAPVQRLFNGGHGGAPNHAYTTAAAKRDLLSSLGWVLEGTAWCVPLATEDTATKTRLLASAHWQFPSAVDIYGDGSISTTFSPKLITDPSLMRWKYESFGLTDVTIAIDHQVNGVFTGLAYFEPLTGRYLVIGNSGFEGDPPYVGVAWELADAAGPASFVCTFAVKRNIDDRYPDRPFDNSHPFQPILWSGCMPGVAKKL